MLDIQALLQNKIAKAKERRAAGVRLLNKATEPRKPIASAIGRLGTCKSASRPKRFSRKTSQCRRKIAPASGWMAEATVLQFAAG